ncbi:hypothetical protein C9E85_04175 [Plesiomonas shigelloides]|uniref:hypothetical protein n=1 Tax=Plesiomonas shigelloides TaxID=703 RepID=UPI000D5856D1|nr:hypothetical protein [Plesiomonas shigelloides]PVU67207.1 hypothetical protein C9E85_04175 [Plesiomonas shigelloides]
MLDHDIYHYLVKQAPEFAGNTDEELNDAIAMYENTAYALGRTINLLGNLTLEAALSEEYSGENARRDMLMLSHALCNLPRIAEALEQNSHTARHVLKERQAGGVQ